jgi:hypothetical protein
MELSWKKSGISFQYYDFTSPYFEYGSDNLTKDDITKQILAESRPDQILDVLEKHNRVIMGCSFISLLQNRFKIGYLILQN